MACIAGDIIDGYHPKDQSLAALDTITAAFDVLSKSHWHMIGNHCLYNLPRDVRNLKIPLLKPNSHCIQHAPCSCQHSLYSSHHIFWDMSGPYRRPELPIKMLVLCVWWGNVLVRRLGLAHGEERCCAQVLNERLNMGGPGGASYYAFSPHPAWRIMVLDGYDVSLLGWPEQHPLHQQARSILAERNPNQVRACTPLIF